MSYFTLTIEETSTGPKWKLVGTHDGFPAYEVYVNDKVIYGYTPGTGPTGPYPLSKILSLYPPLNIPRPLC
jgi:hypothetical protein